MAATPSPRARRAAIEPSRAPVLHAGGLVGGCVGLRRENRHATTGWDRGGFQPRVAASRDGRCATSSTTGRRQLEVTVALPGDSSSVVAPVMIATASFMV